MSYPPYVFVTFEAVSLCPGFKILSVKITIYSQRIAQKEVQTRVQNHRKTAFGNAITESNKGMTESNKGMTESDTTPAFLAVSFSGKTLSAEGN